MTTDPTADPLASIYRYRPIDGRLSTSGQPSVKQLTAIADAGFRVIINLALHDDARYSLPDEPGAVTGLGLSYVHIPVQFAAPQITDLHAFVNAMDANIDEKLWVHCAANIRVSAFLGLYRVIRQGWKPDPAFELMHGLWQPDAAWSVFIDSALASLKS